MRETDQQDPRIDEQTRGSVRTATPVMPALSDPTTGEPVEDPGGEPRTEPSGTPPENPSGRARRW